MQWGNYTEKWEGGGALINDNQGGVWERRSFPKKNLKLYDHSHESFSMEHSENAEERGGKDFANPASESLDQPPHRGVAIAYQGNTKREGGKGKGKKKEMRLSALTSARSIYQRGGEKK